ncbi:unnamed protein product [Rangifer tarandus platyrhynchus]|uniref:Uncharacterized protein n=2 Tax=Rangifer tarandus platyrhynchus TaxID=3082113 RepID=A0AC59ZBJ9_RANTA|nr:unnamed protein product [Rangifer tarandus platyrhynchus]
MLTIFYPLGSAFITYQKGITSCTFASPNGAYISVGPEGCRVTEVAFLLVGGPPHPVHPPPPPPGALRSQPQSPTQPVGFRSSEVLATARALPTAAPSASTSRPGPSSPTNYHRRVLLAPESGTRLFCQSTNQFLTHRAAHHPHASLFTACGPGGILGWGLVLAQHLAEPAHRVRKCSVA